MERDAPAIRGVLHALRRRIALVVICTVVAPVAAFLVSESREKQYTASASLLFRDPGFDQKLFGNEALPTSADPDREAATNATLVSLDVVADRTERRLRGVSGVKEKVEVRPEGQSNIVSIEATDPSPRRAAEIANTFAAEYTDFRREADREKIADARELIENRLDALPPDQRGGTQGQSLSERLEELQLLEALQTGNAEVAEQAAVPTDPSSPKTLRNTVLAALLGLIVGVGLALLLERLDRRIRDPKDLEDIFDRPVLGAVAESRSLARGGGASMGKVNAHEREAFRMLRANLRYFDVDKHVASVLVTSAAPGDGKTTVAWNLAATAADTEGRVLLIEADLRHPAIASGLGLRGIRGLSTVLAGEATLEQVVQEIPIGDRRNGRNVRTVKVLLSGPLPPNPSDLLESERMRELIRQAERDYDLVVIDTPPTSVVSDAIPLVREVGGVIVVGRLGKTTRDGATHLRNQLANLDAPVLGLVVNALKSDSDAYGYSYAYGYGYGEQVPDDETGTARVGR